MNANNKKFNEIENTTKGLVENLQQKTGNNPKEIVWKCLKTINSIDPQSDTQLKFKAQTLDMLKDMFPDFLLTYGKDFTKSKLTTILNDLGDNESKLDDDSNHNLHFYIKQIQDRVLKQKGKNTHKTKEEIQNEILTEMEYNFSVAHGMGEFNAVATESTKLIQIINEQYQAIETNNVTTTWSALNIGMSSVKLYNLEIEHGDYIASKMDKEFSENVSKTTQAKYIKQVLDKKSFTAYSKSNGKNKVELKVHPYIEGITSEKDLKKVKNLTQTKISCLRYIDTKENFLKVLNGDDKPYIKLMARKKKLQSKLKNRKERNLIATEYNSIEISLQNEIERLEINPSVLTMEQYKMYRNKSPHELILDLQKDYYKLYKERDFWKSKAES